MTERYSAYDDWACLYNQSIGPTYAGEKLVLLKRVLLPSVPQRGRLLDLCCGTGNLTHLVAKQGYEVTGLDGSEEMLKFAQGNAPGVRFLLADARTFEVSEKFDGVFCTNAALNHVPRIAELKEVFTRVAHSLKDRRIFVFDINHRANMRLDWRGNPAIGEIEDDHAWVGTTYYDDTSQSGYFTVDIYRPAPGSPVQRLSPLKRSIRWVLRHKRLKNVRLKLLKRFDRFQPQWASTRLTYSIYGYDIDEVKRALQESGFSNVSVQTERGTPATDKDPAYFVCTK